MFCGAADATNPTAAASPVGHGTGTLPSPAAFTFYPSFPFFFSFFQKLLPRGGSEEKYDVREQVRAGSTCRGRPRNTAGCFSPSPTSSLPRRSPGLAPVGAGGTPTAVAARAVPATRAPAGKGHCGAVRYGDVGRGGDFQQVPPQLRGAAAMPALLLPFLF